MRKLSVIMLSIAMCISFSMPSWAATVQPPTAVAETVSNQTTRAEVTVWYYRKVNGVKQKRLWSQTYGYWLTDWMPV